MTAPTNLKEKARRHAAAGPKLGPRPATRDHLVSGKKPLTVRVQVVRDNELADRLMEAQNAYDLEEARFKSKPTDAEREAAFEEARKALDRAIDAADEHIVEVTFRSLGRSKFDLLKRSHPPTEQDVEDAERVGIDAKHLDWSNETFRPALIAACMVDPATGEPIMTEAEFRSHIWESDDWNEAETQLLFLTALKANQARSSVDPKIVSGGSSR